MAITSLSGSSKTGNQVYAYYRSAVTSAKFGSTYTYSVNTTLTSNILIANTLTVNAGITLSAPSNNEPMVIWADTINLNGTIAAGSQAGGTAGATSAVGGTGAGALLVFARQIVGTGTISAAGGTGGTSTANGLGVAGGNGLGFKYQTSTGTSSTANTQVGGTRFTSTNNTSIYTSLFWFLNWQEGWLYVAGSGAGG